jgi:hypothetical protein
MRLCRKHLIHSTKYNKSTIEREAYPLSFFSLPHPSFTPSSPLFLSLFLYSPSLIHRLSLSSLSHPAYPNCLPRVTKQLSLSFPPALISPLFLMLHPVDLLLYLPFSLFPVSLFSPSPSLPKLTTLSLPSLILSLFLPHYPLSPHSISHDERVSRSIPKQLTKHPSLSPLFRPPSSLTVLN